jgi:pimeloyl-ACP methyl ester carboxylesterase
MRESLSLDFDGKICTVDLDRAGTDRRTVLLLPALSSISTRREMRGLQDIMSETFRTVSVDWPGFGDREKPFVNWRPELYDAFLGHLLKKVVPAPFGIVAAGHAAGYVLRHFAQEADDAVRLVFLSPTWRGPLPTMMNGDRPMFSTIAKACDPPILGSMLYKANVNRFVVRMMARGHVYADAQWLDERRMAEKLAVTRVAGARHGSARFVTGCLDPFASREEQLAAATRVRAPLCVMFAGTAPDKSRLEMEALAALPNVATRKFAKGKLSFYEEFPSETAAAIANFMAGSS